MTRSISVVLAVSLVVGYLGAPSAPAAEEHQMLLSFSADRSSPEALSGQTVSGDIYVFVVAETGVKRVWYYLDDPDRVGTPFNIAGGGSPYDLVGENRDGTAKPFDADAAGTGEHIITAELELMDGSRQVLEGTFRVSDDLFFTPSSVELSVTTGGSDSATVDLDTRDGALASFEVSDDASWLEVTPTSGETPETLTLTGDASELPAGTYTATVVATNPDGTYIDGSLKVELNVSAGYEVMVSLSSDRSSPVPLEGQTLSGDIYVFTAPDAGVSEVRFHLDDPELAGSPIQTEIGPPFDLAGTATDGSAVPFEVGQLTPGDHNITAEMLLTSGDVEVVDGNFSVPAALEFAPDVLELSVESGGTDSADVDVLASDGSATNFELSDDADWLTVSPASGSTPSTVTVAVDAAGLSAGTHEARVTATDTSGILLTASLPVTVTVGNDYGLFISFSPDRSNPEPLGGQAVSGSIYVFTAPDTNLRGVDFYLDDPDRTGTPITSDRDAPFDLAGTATDGSALPFDTGSLSEGLHTVTALLRFADRTTQELEGTFSVTAPLAFTPASLEMKADLGGTASADVTLDTGEGSVVAFDITDDAEWLTVDPVTGETPATLTVFADAGTLTDGSYNATVTATSDDGRTTALPVQFNVGNPDCSPLTCEEVLVDLPYILDFSSDAGMILDGSEVGTGFTYIDDPSKGVGYIPENLAVDTVDGVLRVTTTPGLSQTSSNSLDNALGVGVDAPSQVTVVSTKLVGFPEGNGGFEQAGLWFGNDEDNYVKLVVQSKSTGPQLQFLLESGGSVSTVREQDIALGGGEVKFELRADPSTEKVTAYYSIDGAPLSQFNSFTVPAEFFSFDGAGNDIRIGTRSFTGILTSHRNGPAPLVYTFDDFSVTALASPGGEGGGLLGFERVSFPVSSPTSMAWGPDGRLYVSEVFGRVHAFTLDENKQVVSDQVIDTVRNAYGGPRLTLGIEIDPDSTAENVIVWVAHSSGSFDSGAANSSVISKLSGPDLTTMEDVITGLPRAIANHAVNSLHFGPDGRLFIAMGGNTGTGAPNDAETEFGTRPEQPLSAALLAADVKAVGFEGDCASAVDDTTGTAEKTIPATCDVVPYATGLRNMYDFVFHSNGSIYGPDNGLGVKGTVPDSPTPDCQGIVPYGEGEFDPGPQPDPLLRIEEGMYYGHPNPARDECVFKDGSFQGVGPLPNYQPPIHDLGDHKSANGAVEYTSGARCGAMQGDLLIGNFSTGDDITRVVLTEDGLSVASATSLAGGFGNPLPLLIGPDGTIYVGEFGGGKITALVPQDLGCWDSRELLPTKLLDVGGAALSGKLYVVAGKSGNGPVSSVFVYDPVGGSWSTAADLPGPAVENPAVVAGSDGKLYAFGGSTEPFSGAVDNAAAYDPATDAWTPLTPMPTARGGATAQEIGGLMYVVGGMDADSISLNVVEVYDPATDSWTTAAAMDIHRDNPGSAVLDGNLYVFGGRTRDATGEVNGTLASVEMFDLDAGTWSPRASMPTGRRTFVVGTLNGRAQVMGGEKTPSNGTFPQNEEYDPITDTWRTLEPMLTPRHGAAAGTIDGIVYVIAGGPQSGSSFSDINEAFAFEND